MKKFDPLLDSGIEKAVIIFNQADMECAWCGSPSIRLFLRKVNRADYRDDWFAKIHCRQCGCKFEYNLYGYTAREAIEKVVNNWNFRRVKK